METRRARTDKSLRAERHDADQPLRAKQVAETTADKVVDLNRPSSGTTGPKRTRSCRASGRRPTLVCSANARTRATHLQISCRWRERTDRNLLTERARSDEELANRDDFLAIVSHDLRNLLGGIVLSSSLLSKRASETDEGKRIVVTGKRIQRYAARMNRLIGDLVDVVSIDAGHLSCKIVPSDPLALIAETLETFRRAAEEKGIVLQSEVTGALPPAAFDYERMLQVLSNLVSNALNFTPRDGKIGIRGERTGASGKPSRMIHGHGSRPLHLQEHR